MSFKFGYKYNILSIMLKNYNFTDFQNLSSTTKKPQLSIPTGYLGNNSNPQTTPNSNSYYKNMEVDMNHPNELKPTQYQQSTPQPQQPQQTQQYQAPPQQQVQYQQPPQIIYQQPYQPPQQPQIIYQTPPPQHQPVVYQQAPQTSNQSHEYVEFTTKSGDKVKFKPKKIKKPKIKEEQIIINEQTKVEAIPQQHN